MGTPCRITLYAPSEPQAAEAATAAFQRIAALEAILSDYRPDSEAMRLFQQSPHIWHDISPDLAAILRLSSRIHTSTGGAFDPTLGPLTQLWRQSRKQAELPDPDTLADARARSGMHLLEIDPDSDRVRFTTTGMRPDFGAIGKGWAADQAIVVLRTHHAHRTLVDFGGDLVAGDSPLDSPDGWLITIRDGLGEPRQITLRNSAVATSGDVEQYLEIDGIRYSHIIDPRTGLGLTRRRAATVIAPTGALADALASAACVLGTQNLHILTSAFPACRIHLNESCVDEQNGLLIDGNPARITAFPQEHADHSVNNDTVP
jgi:thiamine biosynthesis lipoprotein